MPAATISAQAAAGRQYLTFTVLGETFALPSSGIKEIIEFRPPTDVPMMPAFVRGVINLRGRVVPVIDLAARFGRGASTIGRRTCVVIVEVQQDDGTHDIGVLVDAVNAVVELEQANIEPPPSFGTRMQQDFVAGMGRIGEGFVILLALDRVLSLNDLAALSAGEPEEADTAGAAVAP